MVDTHVHITASEFDKDRNEIIESFDSDGIEFVVEVGADPESSFESVELAGKNAKIYAAVGVHPHGAKRVGKSWIDELDRLAGKPKVVAVGEIGLDYYRDLSPRPLQRKLFEEQLSVAKKHDLPVIFHVRDAYDDAIDILKSHDVSGVFHSFAGSKEDLKKALDLGFYVGVGGIATFKRNSELRESISFAPINMILTETDCPDLAPQPVRGKRNQPGYVRYVVGMLADLFGMKSRDIERTTALNAYDFFGISPNSGLNG